MTNSTYTLSSIKRESSPVPGSDYMDINSDEAEAGSILLSLSKQDKKTPSTTAINTMSIRNLLGDNDDEQQRTTFTTRDQHQMNEAHTYATTSKEMHRYPETAQKKSTSFFDKRSQYHQHGMHVPCISTTTSPLISAPSESSHPPTYSQQSYQSMKKDPKVRRNALHAYISYMTYSDLARTKRINSSYTTKQHTHHSEHPRQHQWPLTAYLTHQPHQQRPQTDWSYHSPPAHPYHPAFDKRH